MKTVGKINLFEIKESDLDLIIMGLETLEKMAMKIQDKEMIMIIATLTFMLKNSNDKEIMNMYYDVKAKIINKGGETIQ